jgi:hypothetical protein
MEVVVPHNTAPTTREIRLGVEHMAGALQAGAYTELAALSAARAAQDGPDETNAFPAHQIPIVQFGVDATLHILSQPDVAARIPNEIIQRSLVARYCSGRVMMLTVGFGIAKTLFEEASPDLRDALTREEWKALENTKDYSDYVRSLVSNVFFEPTIAIGGAHRVLRRLKRDVSPPEVITRSTGLLITARVARENLNVLWKRLGYPYAHPKTLTIKDDGPHEAEPIVDFTTDTIEFIRSLITKTSGCPIRRMAALDGRGTFLTRNLEELTDYLVPATATSYAKTTKLPVA